MMRRMILFGLVAVASSCAPPQNMQIQVPFALLSSDELQAPQIGQPCTYIAVTQAGGFYRESGLLELDPALNPNPDYFLELQVENYMDQTVLTDSNGNPLSGPQRNDFLVTDAIVQYVPEQAYLEPGVAGQKAKFLASGRVAPGGTQTASAIGTSTISPTVASALAQNLANLTINQGISSPGGDLVLEIYFEGNLASGEPAVSGTMQFPMHVCLDCQGSVPSSCAPGVTGPCSCTGLGGGTMAIVGHGPCCAAQDFTEACVACGGLGEPPCAPPANVVFSCGSNADCAGYGVGLPTCAIAAGASTGICVCGSTDPAPDNCAGVYGTGSVCNANGNCTAGCGPGPGGSILCPSVLTSLPQGVELCPYPNASSIGATCVAPTGTNVTGC